MKVQSTVSFTSSTAPKLNDPKGEATVPPAPSPTVVAILAECTLDRSTSAKVIVPVSVSMLDVAVAPVSITAPASSATTIVGASLAPVTTKS